MAERSPNYERALQRLRAIGAYSPIGRDERQVHSTAMKEADALRTYYRMGAAGPIPATPTLNGPIGRFFDIHGATLTAPRQPGMPAPQQPNMTSFVRAYVEQQARQAVQQPYAGRPAGP